MKTRYDDFYRSIPSLGRSERVDAPKPTAPAPKLQLPSVSRQPSVLEVHHPDVVQAITLLWGHPEMNLYFEKLWLDDGRGTPITPEAMSELMLLAGVHGWVAPHRPKQTMASIYDASRGTAHPRDVWADIPRRR